MGLIASIYKPPGGGSSNGGLSSKVERVCIVNVEGPFSPSESEPPVALVRGNLSGNVKMIPARLVAPEMRAVARGGRHVVEVDGELWELDQPPNTAGPMSGGCYVGTSDSRLGLAIGRMTAGGLRYCDGIVDLHDRFEGPGMRAVMD